MAPLTKSRGPKLSDGREGAASTRKKREKKIERVSLFQEAGQQNKQKNMGTIVAQPPEGYTFLTMGYPDLSAKCKDLSAQKGVSVKVVSAYNNSQEDNYRISHHLHRIGYHIRTDIFDEACDNLGYRFVDGKLTKAVTPNPILGFERPLARYEADLAQLGATSATDDESQRVRNAIKELFPNIPETSLNTILKTAWQKGATTIGHVAGLPLSRRVQLATVAHIRHTFTDYDELLRNHPWGEARRLVERTCLQKLVEWRGEDDTDNAAMASMLRETYSESSDDEDYSPAEWSEPDRYADNEDSSDGAYDMTRRPGGSLCLERTHPSFNPGSLAKLASAPAPKPVVSSTATQNISRTASSAMSQGANEGRRRTTEQAQNDSAAVSNYQHALAMTGQTINVPTDSRGRGPSSIFLEGKEYIRVSDRIRSSLCTTSLIVQKATPEDLASLRSEARTSNHQAFAIAPYSPFQYVPQSIHYAPQAVPPSPQYVLQPVGPFYPSPAAHPEHRPIQDLPPQRFFDLQEYDFMKDCLRAWELEIGFAGHEILAEA
ncbi:hypothetical protein ANO11243_000610 [Dothideomycetidae sp. 11243]|nr:hypothetical protein ANO11243_000610 [fungal sp. No.11243]